MNAQLRKIPMFAIVLFLIIGLNYLIRINEETFLKLERYGYIGIFLVCLFLNSTVLLPSSSTAVVMTMATIYNPLVVAVVGAFGATIGEFTGYYAGYYGRSFIKENAYLDKILSIFQKYPSIAIILFAFIPLPIFDVVGIMAGTIKMDRMRFFVLCLVGKCIKMIVYAFLGIYALDSLNTVVSR